MDPKVLPLRPVNALKHEVRQAKNHRGGSDSATFLGCCASCVTLGKTVIAGGPLFTTGHGAFPEIHLDLDRLTQL